MLRLLKKQCASLRRRYHFNSTRNGLLRNFEPLHAKAPRQIDRLGDSDSYTFGHIDGSRARMQRKRRLIEWQLAMADRDAKRFAQFAWPGT